MMTRFCYGWGGKPQLELYDQKEVDSIYNNIVIKRSIMETECPPAIDMVKYCRDMNLSVEEFCGVWSRSDNDGSFSGGSVFVFEFSDEADAMAFKLRWS